MSTRAGCWWSGPFRPMEERPERLQRIRRVAGIPQPAAFPAQPGPFEIPARTHATLLLDQTCLTTAYPELTVSGGKDAVVTVGYAESLYLPAAPGSRSREKGNRDEVEGKQFIGARDQFIPDGGSRRTFRPLWWRAYRYLELDVETKDQPLTIEDLRATYVGYPFERRAQFDGGSAGSQPDSGRGLAHGAPVRPRNLHGLPVLRTAPIRGRHARAMPDFDFQFRRRAPDAQCHRPDRRLAAGRCLHHEPLPDAAGAVHSGLLAVVDRDGAGLLVVCGRPGLRPPHAARRARRVELFRRVPEEGRLARPAAVVALLRLGAGVALGRAAAGSRWLIGALRPAAAAGVPLGSGVGNRGGAAAGSPRFIGRARSSFAKRRSGFTGMPAGACTPIRRPNSNFRSTPIPWRCWEM